MSLMKFYFAAQLRLSGKIALWRDTVPPSHPVPTVSEDACDSGVCGESSGSISKHTAAALVKSGDLAALFIAMLWQT